MDLGLNGKVAIIGGASKGLGRACAQVLAEEGAKVAICSRTAADLEQAASEIRESTGAEVLAYPADLDRLENITGLISAALEQFGGIDVLVNNSGGPPLARSSTATEEQWETAVQRSLIFFGRMCREGIPHLRQRGGGRIVNILASTVYNPIPNLALSGATRMGVVAYAKSLADEVGQDNILVNNVCPGSILSERMLSNVTARANELGISVDEALARRASARPRWAGWDNPKNWPTSWRSWFRSGPATSPGPPSWWTEAWSARSCSHLWTLSRRKRYRQSRRPDAPGLG